MAGVSMEKYVDKITDHIDKRINAFELRMVAQDTKIGKNTKFRQKATAVIATISTLCTFIGGGLVLLVQYFQGR